MTACLIVTPAAAQATNDPTNQPTVEVRMSNAGFDLPETVPAGPVAFRVSSVDGRQHLLDLFQSRQGGPVRRVLGDLRGTSLQNPPPLVSASARKVDQEAEFFGGAQVDRDRPVQVTIVLCPGVYDVIDLIRVLQGSNKVRRLQVRGHHRACESNGPRTGADPKADRPNGLRFEPAAQTPAQVQLVRTVNGPRFRSPDLLPANGRIRFTNATNQGGEMVLQRVRAGVTVEQVYEALENGHSTAPIFEGPAYGLGGLSASHSETLDDRSRPGRYVLLSDAPDIRTGASQVRLGAWRIVHLR
ncbi:hypothetical protein ACQPXS_46900 (plasmid) [Streptomyces sp. CA-142005]|uniref:hypothetical protein n=1 Tax=Streptomyces sp. CA-142005 TaxID=3240052 RepID=UPI003D8E59A7